MANVQIIGDSPMTERLREDIAIAARCQAKVLITGESGVGKEVVARAVHANGPRASTLFEPVNCAGVPESLLESELFGHVKGSFTGAYRDQPGKFETAHMGTLFLDEIGEMTLHMQTMLLRFLETGELQRVGSPHTRRVDVRIISATNRNLAEMIERGTFREDLFYRLNVIRLHVPALRERAIDIPPLARHFLQMFAHGSDSPARDFTADALALLGEYPWHGNVRELENVIEQVVATSTSAIVDMSDLPASVRQWREAAVQKRDRRHGLADDLYERMLERGESFWDVVHPMFMNREITKDHVRAIVRRALQDGRGSYRIVCNLFNMQPGEYKRFLNFLHQHDCHVPFAEFRK